MQREKRPAIPKFSKPEDYTDEQLLQVLDSPIAGLGMYVIDAAANYITEDKMQLIMSFATIYQIGKMTVTQFKNTSARAAYISEARNRWIPEETGNDEYGKTVIQRAIKEIEGRINKILEVEYYTFAYGRKKIGQFTESTYHYNAYMSTMQREFYLEVFGGGMEVGAKIWDAYGEAVKKVGPEPISSGLATIYISAWNIFTEGDGMVGDFPTEAAGLLKEALLKNSGKRIQTQLVKAYYVCNTDYKYLVFADSYRKKFINGLNGLKEEISKSEKKIFDNGGKYDILYKKIQLEYVERIIDMNNNYSESNKRLNDDLNEIERLVKNQGGK